MKNKKVELTKEEKIRKEIRERGKKQEIDIEKAIKKNAKCKSKWKSCKRINRINRRRNRKNKNVKDIS